MALASPAKFNYFRAFKKVAAVDHWSFAPDPYCKGSYYRRIDDIRRALRELGIPSENEGINFVAYFFGCEKLALGIVGINKRCPAENAYCKNKKLDLGDIKNAATKLGLQISATELTDLFDGQGSSSARNLRNKLAHDFGPTQVLNITNIAHDFIPKMKRFLGGAEQVQGYLKAHFSHVVCPRRRP